MCFVVVCFVLLLFRFAFCCCFFFFFSFFITFSFSRMVTLKMKGVCFQNTRTRKERGDKTSPKPDAGTAGHKHRSDRPVDVCRQGGVAARPFPTKPAVGLKAEQGESYVHRESSIMAGCVNTISTYKQLNETHYASFCHCTLESICQKSVLGTFSHRWTTLLQQITAWFWAWRSTWNGAVNNTRG